MDFKKTPKGRVFTSLLPLFFSRSLHGFHCHVAPKVQGGSSVCKTNLILIETPGSVGLSVLRAPCAAGRSPDRPRPERI